MERLGKLRVDREDRRLSEREVIESNPVVAFTGNFSTCLDVARHKDSHQQI